ncbi:hypothetical protein [Parasphingorhabdus sp.]
MKDIGPYLKLTAVMALAVFLVYQSSAESKEDFRAHDHIETQ